MTQPGAGAPSWKRVGGVAVAYLGVVGSLATVYTALDLSWLDGVSKTAWGLVAMVFGLTVVCLATIMELARERTRLADPAPKSMYASIVETLKAEFARGNYSDVIRVGEALSRPFFEAGAFSVRLEIGRMVEEAAARSSRKREQYAALIDSIGWSLVELGRYSEAERQIKHGLRLLEQQPDSFYEAKAHRHIGVIARREKRYDDARAEYEVAARHAQDIANEHDALTMTAGLKYALASLAFHERRLQDAAPEIDAAIASFRALDDEYRLNMALVLRGDVEFERGDLDDARDTFRHVLQNADRNKETLQYVRACLGLAGARAADCEWTEVREVLDLLNDLDLHQYKAERDRLASLRAKLPAS